MSELQPTLWRTCRVLASETKLKILQYLLHKGDCCVSDVANGLGLSLNNASTQLRALNARGLISVRRKGRNVCYRLEANEKLVAPPALMDVITSAILRGVSLDRIFRICTAFTNERRIRIVRMLFHNPQTFRQLRQRVHVCESSLWLHLDKLISRRFVHYRDGVYRLRRVRDPLRRILLDAALDRLPSAQPNTSRMRSQ